MLNKQIKILLIHVTDGFGGAEVHKIELYKMLLQAGYSVDLLVAKNSPMVHELHQKNMAYLTTDSMRYYFFKPLYKRKLARDISMLCQKIKPTLIQCYTEREVWAVKRNSHHSSWVVLERHGPHKLRHPETFNVDGIIAVSKPIESYLNREAKKMNSSAVIHCIQGFFDQDRFLTFTPRRSRDVFFEQHFGITLNKSPIICMIANFYKDSNHKNHPLLFRAIHKLVYEKNKSVNLVLVGDGQARGYLKKRVNELGLNECVHFLGFTNLTADILFHADMHVLASKNEALGLVNLEAGLMRKPLIAATETGSADIIKHEYTGLLFKNNDVDDLVMQIEKLLDNPELAIQLGEQARTYILDNFSNQTKFKQLEQFYEQILSQN